MAMKKTKRRKPKAAAKTKAKARAKPKVKTKAKKRSATLKARPRPSRPAARKPLVTATPRQLPDLEVQATGGRRFRLPSLQGRYVVLYFYPKDDTSGCTQEGCDLRDREAEFARRGAVIYGVSRDSLASHDRFREKYRFPFDLISDPEEKLCRAFGVMKEKNLYGRKYFGIERSTFIFDPQGRLLREFRGVKVPGHVAELLAEIDRT
jgi:peroxiredoxin Q/BCP